MRCRILIVIASARCCIHVNGCEHVFNTISDIFLHQICGRRKTNRLLTWVQLATDSFGLALCSKKEKKGDTLLLVSGKLEASKGEPYPCCCSSSSCWLVMTCTWSGVGWGGICSTLRALHDS